MIHITRRERFNAAHRLFRHDFTDEQNIEVFGKCSNPNWHGHNYELYITVKGNINEMTGFLINLKTLSDAIKQYVINKLDHKNINIEVDFMQGKLASTENLAVGIWEELQQRIHDLGAELHCVKVIESENNYVEYFGK
ncbi:MAG TPA: 6-carboxytetrahydropterin synthase [Bacteroidales bacterium]|mgnify:CR=1 FL=1|jgi:6-pyruvoyltetrahydropterin/6-carboxytetrahydropterin synthase|nr:6-pyruvoyl tetrahydrobiopterin synthase [Bacteroidota bacterium]HJN06660.1 6-carboxytetrahydropterin synthase [Bacteroidales bacterium]|tara:strand:- start:345 stop:758 length:414 start_codon:yes stop_codon:yes gene_type:complete